MITDREHVAIVAAVVGVVANWEEIRQVEPHGAEARDHAPLFPQHRLAFAFDVQCRRANSRHAVALRLRLLPRGQLIV